MAEEQIDEDLDGEEGTEDAELDSSKKDGKKRVLILIGLAMFLVVGGFGAAWYTGVLDPLIAMITGEEAESSKKDPSQRTNYGNAVFHDLDEILVNLNTGGRKSTFLKIRISLELENEQDVTRITELMPRIIDNFQVYLRELRVEDLKGSAGMYRLREELLTRVSAAVHPIKVNDILFKEMLVQ
ncbi:MAG: flagellar basal body-associated FliL family protein [Rhodospirillales bacterium]|nr:flagellar basal body-associated FliL family protein [Rhodospirillales bacterium]